MRRERQKTKRVGIYRDENDETEEPIATKSCDKIHNINFKYNSLLNSQQHLYQIYETYIAG